LFIVFASYPEAYLPRFAKYSHGNDSTTSAHLFLNAFKNLVIYLIPLLILIFLFSKQVVGLLWGSDYLKVDYYLKFNLTLLPFFMLISIAQFYLISMRAHVKLFIYFLSYIVLCGVGAYIGNRIMGSLAIVFTIIILTISLSGLTYSLVWSETKKVRNVN
ncbi:MAG: hypothetical protein ACTSYF_06835, partial [Promethearchaeota archaeon]